MMCLSAGIAQLGERQTEDLKVPGSIPGTGKPNTPAADSLFSSFLCFKNSDLSLLV